MKYWGLSVLYKQLNFVDQAGLQECIRQSFFDRRTVMALADVANRTVPMEIPCVVRNTTDDGAPRVNYVGRPTDDQFLVLERGCACFDPIDDVFSVSVAASH